MTGPYRTPGLVGPNPRVRWSTPREMLNLACELAGRRHPDRELVTAIADAVELAANSCEDWNTARAARALVVAL